MFSFYTRPRNNRDSMETEGGLCWDTSAQEGYKHVTPAPNFSSTPFPLAHPSRASVGHSSRYGLIFFHYFLVPSRNQSRATAASPKRHPKSVSGASKAREAVVDDSFAACRSARGIAGVTHTLAVRGRQWHGLASAVEKKPRCPPGAVARLAPAQSLVTAQLCGGGGIQEVHKS